MTAALFRAAEPGVDRSGGDRQSSLLGGCQCRTVSASSADKAAKSSGVTEVDPPWFCSRGRGGTDPGMRVAADAVQPGATTGSG